MIVSLFGNDNKIHPAKLNPKAEENISIHHIVQTIPQHNNIYFVKKVDYKYNNWPLHLPQYHKMSEKKSNITFYFVERYNQ